METLQYNSLSDQAYEKLKSAIIERRLEPNTKLNMQDIADVFGVSRGPVSEAFIRLEADGLLERKNRVGTFVVPLTKSRLSEMFEARYMIEEYALPAIVANLTDDDLQYFTDIMEQARLLITTADADTFDFTAFVHLDHNFHARLMELCNNETIIRFYESLNSHVQIARVYSSQAFERSKEGLEEHEEMLEVLKARDVDRARQAFRDHLRKSEEGILKLFGENEVL
jgi:DNA-binding GntR family transcriptional regulator